MYEPTMKVKMVKGKNRKANPLYELYHVMRQRCLNPNNLSYKNYGARGISVHPSWLTEDGFENFLNDVGERPSKKHTLDRIDNDGDYAPGNVKWSTRSQQNMNTRRSKELPYLYYWGVRDYWRIDFGGKTAYFKTKPEAEAAWYKLFA